MKNDGLLLDTCALIWLMGKGEMSEVALKEIRIYAKQNKVFLNPMSAWEIGMLVSKNRLSLSLPIESWFTHAAAAPGFNLSPLSVATLIHSTCLPGTPPNDPTDRIMISQARKENLLLVTRDKPLLRYGAQGYVHVLKC